MSLIYKPPVCRILLQQPELRQHLFRGKKGKNREYLACGPQTPGRTVEMPEKISPGGCDLRRAQLMGTFMEVQPLEPLWQGWPVPPAEAGGGREIGGTPVRPASLAQGPPGLNRDVLLVCFLRCWTSLSGV